MLSTALLLPLMALQLGQVLGPPSQPDDGKPPGFELYVEGDYEAAWQTFRAEHRRTGRDYFLYYMGMASLALSRRAQAVEELGAFLEGPADLMVEVTPLQLDAREKVAALRAYMGRLTVKSSVPGATVSVDGTVHGTTPHRDPILLEPGKHQVIVQKPAHDIYLEAIEVPRGGDVAVLASLIPQKPVDEVGPWSLFIRTDIGVNPEVGRRLIPGAARRLRPWLEIAAGALLARDSRGGWVGARAIAELGSWRPALLVGAPFAGPTGGNLTVGYQAGAEVGVGLGARWILQAALSAVSFPGADRTHGRLWIVTSLGVQVRL